MEVAPTYQGYIETATDALLVLQAVLDGKLDPVSRRPYEIERSQLIVSGNVFIFIEEKSGIKRWTDGVPWSPSRILGKFLIYRELDKSRSTTRRSSSRKSSTGQSESFSLPPLSNTGQHQSNISPRAVVGSLNSSYSFRQRGLIKKAMSLKLKTSNSQETVHMVSYYTAEDVENGKLQRPSQSAFFQELRPCPELIDAVDNSTVGNSSRSPGSGPGAGSGSGSGSSPNELSRNQPLQHQLPTNSNAYLSQAYQPISYSNGYQTLQQHQHRQVCLPPTPPFFLPEQHSQGVSKASIQLPPPFPQPQVFQQPGQQQFTIPPLGSYSVYQQQQLQQQLQLQQAAQQGFIPYYAATNTTASQVLIPATNSTGLSNPLGVPPDDMRSRCEPQQLPINHVSRLNLPPMSQFASTQPQPHQHIPPLTQNQPQTQVQLMMQAQQQRQQQQQQHPHHPQQR